MRKTFWAIAVTLVAAVLSGCSSAAVNHQGHGSSPMATIAESGYSSSEIMFAQMMIPHHQQAVEISVLAETRASSVDVKALAKQIKAEQAPEILQMKRWLTAANVGMNMGHDMAMEGLLTDSELIDLQNASGLDFDKLFLQGMIAHHRGAIKMAQTIANSKNSEVADLAAVIIETQNNEIQYMLELLAKN